MNAGNSPLAGRIDFERVGLLGMSLGGAVAAEMGRTDTRIKCIALLDGALHFEVNTQLPEVGVGKPFLAMNNANDPDPGFNFWPENQALYNVATNHAIHLRIKGASHLWFTDLAWIAGPFHCHSPRCVGHGRLHLELLQPLFERPGRSWFRSQQRPTAADSAGLP